MTSTTATPRRLVAGVGALALIVGFVTGPARPAAASTYETYFPRTPPVTWVDGEGRQYLVFSVLTDVGASGPIDQLVVARDNPDGTPDTSWGTYDNPREGAADIPGAKALNPSPPTEGLKLELIVAIDDDGVLSATFVNSACNTSASLCDRWFTRLTVDGTPVGVATHVEATATPSRALPDGSFLALDPDGNAEWRGPDGADRGAPAVTRDTLNQSTVDHAGRLLVSTFGRHVLRKVPGGAQDLDLDLSTTCTGSNTAIGVGRSVADDGFVTVCSTGPVGLTIERRNDEGTIQWTSTGAGSDVRGQLKSSTTSVIDEDDEVWVGGYGEQVPAYPPVGTAQVQRFTSAGPGPVEYVRTSPHFQSYESESHGIHELRPIGGGKVAMADEFGCCLRSGGGYTPESTVTQRLLPEEPLAPSCIPSAVDLTAWDEASATVTFIPCPQQDARVAPTGYRVTATDRDHAYVSSTTTDTIPAPDGRITATLEGLRAGELTRFTVAAFNDVGDGAASVVRPTVLPFSYTTYFVQQQYRDLSVSPSGNVVLQVIDQINTGTLGADEFVDQILDGGTAKQHIEPTARLYRAYFLRDPDKGGLTYWSDKTVTPGISFAEMSERFAHSSEFKTRYGSLTNKQFVAKLYQNVFGRDGDAAGLAYWTKRLDTGRDNRGRVVIQFSESSEGLRRSAPIVQPLTTAYLMLKRLPTPSERALWAELDDFHLDVARIILATHEYAGRALSP